MSNNRMMKEINEVRMGRYLTGEAGSNEREVFEKELESDPALRDQFMAFRRVWENTTGDIQSSWPANPAWDKFLHSIPSAIPQQNKLRTRSLSWAVAAALILALGAAVLFWNNARPIEYAHIQYPDSPILLVDGSKIFLNKGGSVVVHSFKKKKRLVELKGEAYFEVAPNPDKPFFVQAGETITEVVGTSFNIRSENERTSIFVTKGKVIFFSERKKEIAIALTSGEAAYFENLKVERIINPSPNMHSWHSKELTFAMNMPVSVITSDISNFFNQNIIIENESLKNCRISLHGTFKNPELKNLLEAVALSINASLVIDGSQCIIRGGNCF